MLRDEVQPDGHMPLLHSVLRMWVCAGAILNIGLHESCIELSLCCIAAQPACTKARFTYSH